MKLTDEQRKKLCDLIHYAFMDIRMLGYTGNAEQAADLADAFHNLPNELWDEGYSLEQFRDMFLIPYKQKYPGGQVRDFIKGVNEVLELGEDPSAN